MLKGTKLVLPLFLLMIIIALFTTSCWNSRELNELAIVSALAVDLGQEPGTINLTCQVIKPGDMQQGSGQPGGGGSSSKPYYNVSASGQTIFEAIRMIANKIDRRLYFPHLQVLLFSEEIAKNGLGQYLDLLTRDPEFRLNDYILITRGKAAEVLESKTELQSIPGNSIYQLVLKRVNSSFAIGVTLLEFNQRLLSDTAAPLASYLEYKKEDQSIKLTGASVFKRDKLQGYLSELETRGLLWALDEVKAGIVVVECPKKDGKVSLEIVSSKGKIEPQIKEGQPSFKITVSPHVHLSENNCACNYSELKLITQLKDQLKSAVTSEISAALNKSNELQCDIFALGDKLHQRYPKVWLQLAPNWEEILQEAKVEIIIEPRLDNSGMTTKPVR